LPFALSSSLASSHLILENYSDVDTFSVSKNLEKRHRKVRFVLYCHYHFTWYGAGGKEYNPLPLCVELKIKEEFGCGSGLFFGYILTNERKSKGKNTNTGIDADTETKAREKKK
jgi:hypothetical protein